MSKIDYEIRFADGADLAATGDGIVEGYPVVYDVPADICGAWTEYVDRGALDGCDLRDVQLLVNHDAQRITLARSRRNNSNSTMQLTPDDKGLHMRATLDVENNGEARALYSAIKRGDVCGMSFRFSVEADEWSDLDSDHPTRHIKSIRRIREVSAVNDPAYTQTSIEARAVQESKALANARAAAAAAVAPSRALELEKAKISIIFRRF